MHELRRLAGGVMAALVAGSAAAAATPCDVKLNVTDQDPAGLNVRASPAGPVIAHLKARNRWVQVHVIAQADAGGWAEIDDAGVFLNDEGAPTPLFHGDGYVAFSMLGVVYLTPGAEIFAEPSTKARLVGRLPRLDEGKMPKGKVLGCRGTFLTVLVNDLVGFTQNYCSNQYTTCN